MGKKRNQARTVIGSIRVDTVVTIPEYGDDKKYIVRGMKNIGSLQTAELIVREVDNPNARAFHIYAAKCRIDSRATAQRRKDHLTEADKILAKPAYAR